MVIGAPDVVFVYALDGKGRRIPKFADKYVYFSFVSVEGCNLEITFAPNNNNNNNALIDNVSQRSGSDVAEHLEDDSVLGPDDPYYKDMKKLFRLTDLNESKYGTSCY